MSVKGVIYMKVKKEAKFLFTATVSPMPEDPFRTETI